MTDKIKSHKPLNPVLWTSEDMHRVFYFDRSELMARVIKGTGSSYQAFFQLQGETIYGPRVIDNIGPAMENFGSEGRHGISLVAMNALESWLHDERLVPR